jgi:hypothetical protein
VLAQGTSAVPTGVTIDIGREIAARFGVGVEFVCLDAPRHSFAALMTGRADPRTRVKGQVCRGGREAEWRVGIIDGSVVISPDLRGSGNDESGW